MKAPSSLRAPSFRIPISMPTLQNHEQQRCNERECRAVGANNRQEMMDLVLGPDGGEHETHRRAL